MNAQFEHQPRFTALAMRDDDRFVLTVRLPSGEVIDVPLGPLPREMPFWIEDEPER